MTDCFLVIQYLSDVINVNINAINIPVPISLCTSIKLHCVTVFTSMCIITFTAKSL